MTSVPATPNDPTELSPELDAEIRRAAQAAHQGESPAAIGSYLVRIVQAAVVAEQARANRLQTDLDATIETLAEKSREWAEQYDRAHVATEKARRWETEAERLAAAGRALQTDRDEQRLRAEALEVQLAAAKERVEQLEEIHLPAAHSLSTHLRAQLVAAEARANQLQKRIDGYEDQMNWFTTCENCARLLDASYAETMRAETAEARANQAEAERPMNWGRQNGKTLMHRAQAAEAALKRIRSIGATSGTNINAMNEIFDVIDAVLGAALNSTTKATDNNASENE